MSTVDSISALQEDNARLSHALSALKMALFTIQGDGIEMLPFSAFYTPDDDYCYSQFVPVVIGGPHRPPCGGYAVDW